MRVNLAQKNARDVNSERYAWLVKVHEVPRLLQDHGWYVATTRCSHRQYKHASKLGRVTVPGKPSDEVAPGTLNSILKQVGLNR